MMKRLNYTDEAVIKAIREGGKACDEVMAFLYRRQVEQVVAFITTRNGSREEAKDVFQDALVNLLVAIREGKFEGKSSLNTYLYAISKNLWYRRFNRSVKEDDYKNANAGDEKTDFTPEVHIMDNDQRSLVSNLLGSLKAKCREVLILWAEKYSMKEIAEELGYQNEQVVRNKKNHCLSELKELVRNHPEARTLIEELVG
ncbi:MAG: sigma-70 family RNA polymerase sigma factor [Bacteroidia bacterium]|nr:sigma-70 family RNA polymerase sigma factor [Bacteroidia bacterium]